jgi:uncharacterized OB-fold protein
MRDENRGFSVAKCIGCGAIYFPRRFVCRACGGSSWSDHLVVDAIVEETTVVNHAAGRENWTPRHIGTVRTPDGLRLIVGLAAPVKDGSRVSLTERDGVPFARLSAEPRNGI